MEMTIPTTQSHGKNKMRSCIHSLKKDALHTLHVQHILYPGTVLSSRGIKVRNTQRFQSSETDKRNMMFSGIRQEAKGTVGVQLRGIDPSWGRGSVPQMMTSKFKRKPE